jgi:predicted alpha/beta-fold hydrolase
MLKHKLKVFGSDVYSAKVVDGFKTTTLAGFDDCWTGPVEGFADSADYYASTGTVDPEQLARMPVPMLALFASNDPICPRHSCVPFPAGQVEGTRYVLGLVPHGGHLGFVDGKDKFWEQRVIAEWFVACWQASLPQALAAEAPEDAATSAADVICGVAQVADVLA